MAAPPCHPRSTTLPALIEELVEEILIRIPPDEPAHLFCAALVCKPWRRIVSDPGFLRRYRAFHRRRPPLLGFFCNNWSQRGRGGYISSFKPAASSAFPCLAVPAQYRCCDWYVLDCRHGRVLLREWLCKNLIVWDPISDAWQELQVPNDIYECDSYHVAVLCAVAGCDHHGCHGGPFLVVCLGFDEATEGTTIFRARVYSSEARTWGAPVSSQFDGGCVFDIIYGRAAVVGDKIYWLVFPGANIVQYDLVKRCISFFSSLTICSSEASHKWPAIFGEVLVLTQTEDGLLGLASIGDDSRLYLCSSNHDGKLVAERVIELDKILPIDMNEHSDQVYVSGFAEGVGILFISTPVGTISFEVKSGRVRKITASRDYNAFPFISFFTPSEATGHSATSAEPALALKELYVDSPYIKVIAAATKMSMYI